MKVYDLTEEDDTEFKLSFTSSKVTIEAIKNTLDRFYLNDKCLERNYPKIPASRLNLVFDLNKRALEKLIIGLIVDKHESINNSSTKHSKIYLDII